MENIRFQQSDGGRSESKRKKQLNDCTVRALANATEVVYDYAYDVLKAHGRKCSQGYEIQNDLVQTAKKGTAYAGYYWSYHDLDKDKITTKIASEKFPKGNYILEYYEHVAALVDGVLYDEGIEDLEKWYTTEQVYSVFTIGCKCHNYEHFPIVETLMHTKPSRLKSITVGEYLSEVKNFDFPP